MPKIIIDGQPYEAPADKNLLEALLSLGFNVPYFCWHPAMGSVGACRQCAVKIYRDQNDKSGKIVMSCMTPVTEGLRLSVSDPEVLEFRRRVIEWLMLNHPHDCPVCDEGGECHLQDMTVMTGHEYRRFRGKKRTYRNQDLGPFINHEMNRCIQCYRCVRFYRDYAGGRDFDAFSLRNLVYFGRHEDGALESEFSGNLIEVCPTGVFTDKTLKKHYTRKWDLETAPSVCVHCGLGCNTIPGARYSSLRRVYARYNDGVNGYFICDRGRFGYEFVNDPQRFRQPQAKDSALSWEEALAQAAEMLGVCRRVLGIGSPRASLEANYTLKALVGEEAYSTGLSTADQEGLAQALEILQNGSARSASLAEVETADVILVLGTDPTNEAPMLDLAIRRARYKSAVPAAESLGIPAWNDHAVRDALHTQRGHLYIASSVGLKLEEVATESWHLSPPELAEFAWAVEKALREKSGEEATPPGCVAKDLASAKQPLIVVDTNHKGLLKAAGSMAAVLSKRDSPFLISIVAPECNSLGVALLGGRSVDEALQEIESGQADGLIILENDLFRRASPRRVESALSALRGLIVLDCLPTKITVAADLVLPAATFAESMGTLVNNEGRAQRFYQVFTPTGDPRPSWRILRDLTEMRRPGAAPWQTCEDLTRAVSESHSSLAGAIEAAPSATWRDKTGAKIAREPHRYTGRTSEHAHLSVFEPQPEVDPDSPFSFSMEGYQGQPPAALVPRFWAPGWNSAQALNRFQMEVGGPLRGGPIGKRLLEPNVSFGLGGVGGGLLQTPPPESAPEKHAVSLGKEEIWLVTRAAIFGSEELSRRAPAIASLSPTPTISLHPEEAASRCLAEAEMLRLEVDGETWLLPLRFDARVARGTASVPAGHPETAGIVRICRAKIGKAP